MDTTIKRLLENRRKPNDVSEKVMDIASEIHQKIRTDVHKVMTSPSSFGFPEDEVDDYSQVDVSFQDDYLMVEVRAEVGYDGLMELCDELNPTVEYYDDESYFEPVMGGIIAAYLEIAKLEKIKEAVEDESVGTEWEYWEMPKNYKGPWTHPNYSKNYGKDLIGFIYPPYEASSRFLKDMTHSDYIAEMYDNKSTDVIAEKSFSTLEDAKAWLDELAESNVKESVKESVGNDSELLGLLTKLRTEATEALYKYEQMHDIGECKAILQYLVRDSKSTLDYLNKM